MNKELHIHLEEPKVIHDVITSYKATEDALYDKEDIIHTTQIHFCDTKWIIKGYKIFIHNLDEEIIEIELGYNEYIGQIIKPYTNLFKLLMANDFGFVTQQRIPYNSKRRHL